MSHKKKAKNISIDNNQRKIIIAINNHTNYNKNYKNLKKEFADFVFNKTQLTWSQLHQCNYQSGGAESVKDGMLIRIKNEMGDTCYNQLRNIKLFSSKLDDRYRIIFSRENDVLIIQYISNHYSDH